LTGLTIDDWDETVIDPACGSGTLLVSAYRRKMEIYTKLYGYQNLGEIHKRFVENDITGIDIMPFAAHLSAINLTMQNIEYPTNVVRIATQDALELAEKLKTKDFKTKGVRISPYTEAIQKTLTDIILNKEVKGALSPEGKGESFYIKPVDVVIMNPPYSDREKMPKDTREKLKKNMLGEICGHQVNLWGYFLALSHYLLKDGGKIGAVIPINIARGKATEKIRNFLLENYHIRYIIKPVGDYHQWSASEMSNGDILGVWE
jgi:type I restriction-modification system DNA methylase subunit